MAINWQDVITNIVATVGGGAVLLGAAAWLIKSALTHKLAQDTEVFKTQLRANANAEIERLKASLQIAAVEHQVRFAKLHERRAELIAELYERLTKLMWEVRDFALSSEGVGIDIPEQWEKFSNLRKEMWDLVRFVEARRIYLPVRAATVLDKFLGSLRAQLMKAGIYGGIKYPNAETSRQITSTFTKIYEAFEKEIPEAKAALDLEFRAILDEASGKQ